MTADAVIRPARESDLGLVYGAWRESFYDSNDAGPLPADLYRAAYRETITRILALPDTIVQVAQSPRDESLLYGFIAYEYAAPFSTLFYIYVKQPYRQNGIATALMTAAGLGAMTRFTHWFRTPAWRDHMQRWRLARFDPLPARRLKEKP